MSAVSVFHRQLPAYSPLSLSAWGHAVVAQVFGGRQEVVRATELVRREFHAASVLLVDSGRSALQLAIEAAVGHTGQRVVALPAFQCFEVGAAAVGARCSIALYDVDPATLQPDVESLESAVRAGARVVVVAPLYGIPVDWDAVLSLVSRYDGIVIEDAAQAIGAEWRGRPVGSWGSLSVLSFGRGKGWTGGAGGALCIRPDGVDTSRLKIADGGATEAARLVVTAALQWAAGRPSLYGIPSSIPMLALGETRYRPPAPPAAISEFSAGLLRRTFEMSQREARERRATAERWRTDLQSIASDMVPPIPVGGVAGYVRFPVRVPRGAERLRRAPNARRAGMAASYPKSLMCVAELSDRLLHRDRVYPGAKCLADELLTLPTHSLLTTADRAIILDLCAKWVKTPRSL